MILEDRDGDESHECRSASLTRGMRAAHCAPTVYESNVRLMAELTKQLFKLPSLPDKNLTI